MTYSFPTRRSSELLAYAGLRPQEALAMRWDDVRERTLLIEKASDGQGGVKPTKTSQSRTVRLLAPLGGDLAEWRLICGRPERSEEHTSELQSLMRISYAVFCLKKKTRQLIQ